MRTWLVLDCNYLCYRSHFAMRKIYHDGDPTGATFGFFRDIVDLRDRFDTQNFVFCFDHGCGKRKELLSTYKESRESKSAIELEERAVIQKQIQDLRTKHLHRLGFKNVISQPGYEADDMIASIVRYSLSDEDDAVIISSDKDLLQLLDCRTIIYNPGAKKLTNAKSFREEWGIDPTIWADIKAFAGCATDDIPGIDGVGEKTAVKWFLSQLTPGTKKYEAMSQGLDVYNRNIKLTRLPFPGVEIFKIFEDKIDRDAWREITGRMGMKSIKERV